MKANKLFSIIALFAIITVGFIACNNDNDTTSHTHEWGDWVVTTPATCTTAGVETRVCGLDASHIQTQAIPIDPNAHDWGEWVVTTPATVEAEGVETATCKHNPEHAQTRAIPKIQLFTSVAALGTWLASQPENTAETVYTVKLNTNNISNIRTTLNSAANKYVNLDLSGSSITSIAEGLFYDENSDIGCATLTGIILPNNVTSIGQGAFCRTSLTSITIPNRVTSIGNWAFWGCDSLTEINVDAGNSAYTAENGVLYNKNKTTLVAYPGGKTGAFTIPNSVTSIGDWAFGGCSLTSVTIPNSVSSIGDRAFDECTRLTSVTIGNSVTSIGIVPFSLCTSLTEINVDAGNSAYTAENGVLYNKNKTTLIAYPSATVFTIPNSVTSLRDYAFNHCTSLTRVTIPDSVTSIGNAVFYRCDSLTSVTFEGTISSSSFHSNALGYPNNIGDLRTKYLAGGKGTYTRPTSTSTTWTKQ
jgi:hypothetical protein